VWYDDVDPFLRIRHLESHSRVTAEYRFLDEEHSAIRGKSTEEVLRALEDEIPAKM
jgi:hypothetical protein